MNKRPNLKIKRDWLDYLLEICSILILFSIVIVVMVNYSTLQNIIPTHYNLTGAADSYGSKNTMWIYPLVAILFYVGLSIVIKYPHKFNYPITITNLNVKRVYKLGIMVIRLIKLLFLVLLFYVSLKTIYGI
jgi:uncharacterized membrane protein